MSILEMELQNVKEKNEKLLDTTQQTIMALEDSNSKLQVSFHEKEWNCSAMKKELCTREQLLKANNQKAKQLICDIMSTPQKSLAKRQEKDRYPLQQICSQDQALPIQIKHLQEEVKPGVRQVSPPYPTVTRFQHS